MKPTESKPSWRNWGDHPFVVLISAIASLITIIAFLTGKSAIASLLGASTQVSTNTLSAIRTSQPTTTNAPSPTQTAILPELTLGIGSTTMGKDDMTLLYVPAGEFTMGSDYGIFDELPIHVVNLDSFWVDQTEVTNARYALCVKDGGCKMPDFSKSYARDIYYGNSEFDNYPVIYVSWDDAKAYCSWAGRRLLTEAEWEKAARDDSGRIYPWGNNTPNDNLLNYDQNVGDTTEVGKYPNGTSLYGALDIAGNVWEWVADWYDTYYVSSSTSNPLGPASGTYRVLRGGSWNDKVNDVRSANRLRYIPANTNINIGFRCAVSATP